mgnify:CR=1 FL=1|tara:strand:+ start:485 stop:865 length:381 start_codon:yes stop_codon:yes gene_type:complete
MIKVKIENIKTYGYHGVYKEERKNGQNFYINIIYTSGSSNKEWFNDSIEDILDYTEVIKKIKLFISGSVLKEKYFLLELLIDELSIYLTKDFKNYNFKCLSLSITKSIVIDGEKNNVTVEKLDFNE